MSILSAFSLAALTGLTALAITYGMGVMAKQKLQNALDAAALATSFNLPQGTAAATNIGIQVYQKQIPPGSTLGTIDASAFTFGVWDDATQTFTPAVAGGNTTPIYFLGNNPVYYNAVQISVGGANTSKPYINTFFGGLLGGGPNGSAGGGAAASGTPATTAQSASGGSSSQASSGASSSGAVTAQSGSSASSSQGGQSSGTSTNGTVGTVGGGSGSTPNNPLSIGASAVGYTPPTPCLNVTNIGGTYYAAVINGTNYFPPQSHGSEVRLTRF